ncbi:UNVERIFIED_CONTAM: hypothetical protein Sradi_3285700 [Sesamum radiatum]|uniref:Integrase catalytic domain-containing protein n=1 Tax=Sesamum radiatum TaxID=300843 RepID=A0AAW2R073_SESRA
MLGGRSLATKILRNGYFWPTIQRDSMQMVRKCVNCQIHGNLHHTPAVGIEFTCPTWPFDHWGMDIIGPFPPATGQRKFVLVAVDHFTKWIEAEPLARITEEAVVKFLWRNLLCRFRVLQKITTDNGTPVPRKEIERMVCQMEYTPFIQMLPVLISSCELQRYSRTH